MRTLLRPAFTARILAAWMLCLLAACGQPQTQATARFTAPPQLQAHAFDAGDGAPHGLRQWLPAGKPRVVVLALHGFNDYSHAFQRMGERFSAEGIAVIAPDQRGFGQSPARGIWPGEENLRHDAAQLVRVAKAHYPNTPLVVLGESMGGAVVLSALAHGDIAAADVAGVALVAPAVWGGDSFNPIYRAPLWLLANLTPDAVLNGRGLRILPSDNLPMLMALAKDKNMIRNSRADAVLGLVHLMDSGLESGTNLPPNLPILIQYGARDMVVPAEPVAQLVGHCRAQHPTTCRAARYEHGYHMLLRDLQADTVMQDLIAWIRNPQAALPSGEEWLPPSKPTP